MPRSHKVRSDLSPALYVVTSNCPIAGFTVKHELLTYLEKNGYPREKPLWRVYSMPDGRLGGSRLMTTDELFGFCCSNCAVGIRCAGGCEVVK